MVATSRTAFGKDVLASSKVVLIDVWAPWCPPCRAMEPVLESLESEIDNWGQVVKLDASQEMDFVQELGVRGLPTYLIYNHGKIVESGSGLTTKDSLIQMLSRAR